MSEANPIQKTLDIIVNQIQDCERQAADKRRTANDLCRLLQQPPMFADIDAGISAVSTREDEYYGRQMPDVMKTILEKRKRSNLGAATINEIFEAMLAGGYAFNAQNNLYAKRGLYGVVANDAQFHRLPEGRIGLAAWYPSVRPATELNGKKTKQARIKRLPRHPLKKVKRDAPRKQTRLQQVRELIVANGPMDRKDIRAKSGLPEGTVAYLLNEKNFKHLADGRWDVHEGNVTKP